LGRALIAAAAPALIVLSTQIGAMAAASWLTGITATTFTDGHMRAFLLITGAGGLTGMLIAARRLRRLNA
jgi:hypothetical protein